MEQRQAALTLAEYSANRLAQGDVSGAVELALPDSPVAVPPVHRAVCACRSYAVTPWSPAYRDSILEAPVTAQAQKALTDALGVYNLADPSLFG